MKKTLFKKMLSVVSLMLVFVMVLSSCSLFHKHSFGEWEVEKEATCTESGERKRACSSCGEVQTERIDAKGHTIEDGFCTDCKEIFDPYKALAHAVKTKGTRSSDNTYKLSRKLSNSEAWISCDATDGKLAFGYLTEDIVFAIYLEPSQNKYDVGMLDTLGSSSNMTTGYIYNHIELSSPKVYNVSSTGSVSSALKEIMAMMAGITLENASVILSQYETGITMGMLGFSNIK